MTENLARRVRDAGRRRSEHRARTRAMAADLASYRTTADLLELSAVLQRHDDSTTAEIRDLVDLTPAA